MIIDKTLSRIIKRLETLELDHLRQHVSELAERLEDAQRDADRAWDQAEYWREQCFELTKELQGEGRQVCMDQSGNMSVGADEPRIGRGA